jgi:hypothetical protein
MTKDVSAVTKRVLNEKSDIFIVCGGVFDGMDDSGGLFQKDENENIIAGGFLSPSASSARCRNSMGWAVGRFGRCFNPERRINWVLQDKGTD